MSKLFFSIYKLRLRVRGLKCEGCNLGNDYYSNGYRCLRSGLFFHEECCESSPEIYNLYHPQHSLHFKVLAPNEDANGECKVCRGNLSKMYYYCSKCDFAIDLICAKKEVTTIIEDPKSHEHPLSLVPEIVMFTCHLCQQLDDRFPYECNICHLRFHKGCAESTPEIDFSCHPKHLLKRLTCIPSYSNGDCCLCKNKFDKMLYYCSICDFSVDVKCAKNPPPLTVDCLKVHEHSLTLMPQRIFVCDVCGMMDDDSNPYVCFQCNFMIHRNCIDIPHVIKIGRHDHRIYYNQYLNAGDWKCEVCHKKITWKYGAYCCSTCPSFAAHIRCATKFGIWDGIELENVPEDTLEVKSYEVIDDERTIKHLGHKNHTLNLREEGDAHGDVWCNACSYPIYSSPFYSCMNCDDFILHKKCAYLPLKKIDALYKVSTTLLTDPMEVPLKCCIACGNFYEGFMYVNRESNVYLDVRCGSISEPFVHESHPLHPLYVNYSKKDIFCNACGDKATMVLSCEECEFYLDIKCSILPKTTKHKSDKDHVLCLSYGDKTNDKYWCDICEEELNPNKWFYSCDYCGFTSHIKCTLGDFIWFKQRSIVGPSITKEIQNNHANRPVCSSCGSRCYSPSIVEYRGKPVCSTKCFHKEFFNRIW